MSTDPTSPDALLQLLDAERAALVAAVEGVPEAVRTTRPAPDRWSVVEVIEHVATVDRTVARVVAMRAAEPASATPEELARAQMTPARAALVRDRNQRVESPPKLHPTGSLSVGAALEQLAAARQALKQTYLATDAARLDAAVHVHPLLGPFTLRAWIEFAAHHDARHAAQIKEIAAELAS